MGERRIIALDADADFDRVADLADRAADYVRLESGSAPNLDFVRDTLTDKPPACGPNDIFLRGVERPDGTLAGIATSIRHFYAPGDWYMGLLLLDPAERGAGLGRHVAEHVIAEARADGAPRIRIAVLDANPRGRKFWESLGYSLEKSVQGDDHLRHVLKLELGG